jgi:hypothetical protein
VSCLLSSRSGQLRAVPLLAASGAERHARTCDKRGVDRVGGKINRAAAAAVSESEGEDATARDGPMPGGSRVEARRPS